MVKSKDYVATKAAQRIGRAQERAQRRDEPETEQQEIARHRAVRDSIARKYGHRPVTGVPRA